MNTIASDHTVADDEELHPHDPTPRSHNERTAYVEPPQSPEHDAAAPGGPADSDPLSGQRLTRRRRDIELLKINGGAGNIKESTRASNMQTQRAIWKRCIADLAGDNLEAEGMLTATQITEHFVWLAMNMAFTPSTYARYRTALLSELQLWIETSGNLEEQQDYISARKILLDPKHKPDNMFYGVDPNEAPKSRQRHEKKISRLDVKKLCEALESSAGKGRKTLCFIRASIATGLRPSEWENAFIDHDGMLSTKRTKIHKHIPAYQRVKMAASVAGREITDAYEADQILTAKFGGIPDMEINEIRKIEIPDDARIFVIEHLENVSHAKNNGIEGFARFQSACSKHLYRTCEKIWKGEKLYTLYSFRHQFAANAKRTMSLDQVEFVMGSNSAMKYAKRSQSWSGLPGAGNHHAQRPMDAPQADTMVQPLPADAP